MGSFKSLRHAMLRVVTTFLAALIALASVGTLVELATATVAAAAAPTITSQGYAEYETTGVYTTTITAASNAKALPQATINVLSTTGFTNGYVGLTVTTSAGAQPVFCTGDNTGTTFTTCDLGTGTMATGDLVSSAGPSQFDVYTLISGGAA